MIIKYSFFFLLKTLNIDIKNYLLKKVLSILLDIYLHIIIARLVILSMIFPQGGFFKKIEVYEEFCSFIDLICKSASEAVKNINSNNINNVESFINKLEKFKLNNNEYKNKNYLNIEKNLSNITENFNNYKLGKDSKEQRKKLTTSLKKLYSDLYSINDISLMGFLFTFKYTESLIYMENHMMNFFLSHKVEKITISKNFDIYLFSPKNITKNNNILTIFCNQNGICCEYYSVYQDNIYYYLNDLNCTIILWNYKGFGLRKGFTTFGNIDKDVDILSNYIKNNYNKYKIIIHGCSIGGYSSIKLTQKIYLFNDNTVLICDRTFGDIKNVVQSFNYPIILTIIYNIIFPKWYFKYRNIENYFSLPYDKKLILFDEKDEVIPYYPSSLIYCLTKIYYKDKVKPFLSKYKKCSNIFKNLNNYYNELIDIYNKIEKDFDEISGIFLKKLHKYLIINSFEDFFMFFIIFGYPFNRYKEIYNDNIVLNENYINIPFVVGNIIGNNKNKISNNLTEFISVMNFLFIKFNLNCNLNDDDILKFNYDEGNNAVFKVEENHLNEIKKYFGCVHRIFCGHDGKIEVSDFSAIKIFLKNNNFI